MRLYFVRHGQSESNLAHVHAGWGDYALTAQGKEDARQTGRVLKGVSFDKVYSSDLCRAIQTQQIALPDAEAERLSILREVNIGPEIMGKSPAECEEKYGDIYIQGKRRYDFSAIGGESRSEFLARIRSFLKMMEECPYERVAAFCHGGLIQNALDVVTGMELGKSDFICSNGSVSVLEYRDGKWRVVCWNVTETL